MKSLTTYINEELSDNLLWKLSKWFERNESQEKEFFNLLISCKQNGINVKNVEKYLEGTSLYDNLKEFVNFIDDDINVDDLKDYFYKMKQIIETTLNNKSKGNKYNLV